MMSFNRIFKIILATVNCLIPKNDKIIFISKPDFSDNPRRFFEYLRKINSINYKLLWIVRDKNVQQILINNNINVEYFPSIKAIKEIFLAKVIISSHSSFLGISAKNQIYVDMWHGMVLKKKNFMDNDITPSYLEYLKRSLPKIDLILSTSSLSKTLYSSCFHLEENKIAITGLPRCDALFSRNKQKNLEKILSTNLNIYNKIIFYLPTFREGYKGRIEGIRISKNLFHFNKFDWRKFLNFLKLNNILFLCKLHPFEETQYQEKISLYNSKYFKLLKSRDLNLNLLDLYEVLGFANLLITDYSSVYIDFLLLNRPIIFVANDLDEYRKNRGFLLEPYEYWTPGTKVRNQIELQREIFRCLNNPKYHAKERKIINDIMNFYKDGKSCERVWNVIKSYLAT